MIEPPIAATSPSTRDCSEATPKPLTDQPVPEFDMGEGLEATLFAENPELERRLAPLETLRITPLEIWERYPQQQNIVAVLTGKPALPASSP